MTAETALGWPCPCGRNPCRRQQAVLDRHPADLRDQIAKTTLQHPLPEAPKRSHA